MFFQFHKNNENKNNLIHSNLISNEQKNWLKIQKLLSKSLLYDKKIKYPTNKISKLSFLVVNTKGFEFIIILLIVVNVVQMSLVYDGMSEYYASKVNIMNIVFTILFLIESFLKIIAKGWKNYFFRSKWDLFDFIIVQVSFFEDIFLKYIIGRSYSVLKFEPKLLRIFKVLRLGRIFKLARKLTGLRNLAKTLLFTIPSLLNIGSIALIIYFIYANLGCYLFSNIKRGNKIDEFYNFWNFKTSFVTLFRISTGEDWHLFMFDFTKKPPYCQINIDCGNGINYSKFSLKIRFF